MENTIRSYRHYLKTLNKHTLKIVIGIAIAIAIAVPLYMYRQKRINDFNEVWSRIYQINYELAIAQQEKQMETIEGSINEYTFLKKNLSPTAATPWLLLELGNSQYKAKKLDEAILTYREFITHFHKHPLAPVIRQSLGYALEEKGQMKEAVEQFEAIAKNAESAYLKAQSRLDAGRCYEKLGQLNLASAAYKDIIDSFPEGEWAKMAKYRQEDIK